MRLRFAAPLLLAGSIVATVLAIHQASSDPYAGGYTVKVEPSAGVGSGFHIGDGYIVTAAHVVNDDNAGKIYTDMGAFRSYVVMWINRDLDIALLLVDEPINIDSVDFDCGPPERQPVVVKGLPMGVDFLETSTYIGSKVYTDIPEKDGNVVWKFLVVIDSKISQGMSGGPVVDRFGDVVAVLVGGGENVSVAVPAQEVCKLLQN